MNSLPHQLLSALKDFLVWWRAELLALVPARLRQLSVPRGHLVLMLDGASRATLFVDEPGNLMTLGRVDQPTGSAGRAALQALLQHPVITESGGNGRLPRCLRLPARCGLCRTIELPLAAAANLREVVGFELDLYTPFRAEQAYYTCRVVGRDLAAGRLSVEIIVVPRAAVDEALTTAQELGWSCERVDLADPKPGSTHSDNLLAPQRAAQDRRGRWTYRLTTAAAVLAVIAAAIPFVAAQRRASAAEAELRALHQRAQTAIALQEKLQTLRDDEDFLIERKHRLVTISQLLAETTRILPDDTWLVEMRVNGADVEFVGVTASASALIGTLERSGVFRGTSFRSPVTPDPASGKERFDIAAQIVIAGRQ